MKNQVKVILLFSLLLSTVFSEDYTLLKTISIHQTSTLPLGFNNNSSTEPYTFNIYTKTSINPISQREYLTSAKFNLSNPPESLTNPSDSIPKYNLFDHPSEAPAFTYLENNIMSITTLHSDIFILKVKVISSECLTPLFFLDNNEENNIKIDDKDIILNLGEPGSDNHNRFLDFLANYYQIKNGNEFKLVNGFPNNSDLFLKVYCFYWSKPIAPKIILELFFDKKSHIDISLGKNCLF